MGVGKPPLKAYGILLGAQVAIGAAAIFARFALHGAGPLAVSALRLTIAAVPLLIISWKQSKELSIPRLHEQLFALSGLALAIHFATWIASLLYTSVAISTLLVCTVPVWTALYDTLILKQQVGRKFWLSLLAASFGVYLIVSSNTGSAPVPGLEWLGNLLAIVGSIMFAGYLTAIRSVSNRYPTIVVVSRTYSWAALALSLSAVAMQQMPPGNDVGSWCGIIAMALISQVLGHTSLNAALRWFAPSTVASTTLLEPVCAAALAALIFAEHLSFVAVIGSVIVLGSLAIILRLKANEQAPFTSNEL